MSVTFNKKNMLLASCPFFNFVCVWGGGGGAQTYSTVLKLLFDTDTNLLGMGVHFCVLSSCFRNCISWSLVSEVVVYIAN